MSCNPTFTTRSAVVRHIRAGILALAVVWLALGTCVAQDPQGDWHGTLNAGMAKLRTQLHVSKDAAGAYSAALDSIDQGATGIPVQTVVVSGRSFTLELPDLQAKYEGTISADGSKIEGTLTQAGQSFPMVFEKGLFDLPAVQKGRPMTDEERASLIAHLERTQNLYRDTLAGVTPAQWSFKPAPDRWSLAEVAEHIVKAEDMLRGYATGRVLRIPTPPDFVEPSPEQYKESDAKVLADAVDRSQKAQAIEPTRPTGAYKTVDLALQAFAENRARSIEYARTSQEDVRAHFTPHPTLSRMDAYQYLLMLAGHVERHVAQMNEVKAAAGYPK